ncbi:MAG: hypothetical protein ABIW36_05230 [Terrimesophilobacter sp.]
MTDVVHNCTIGCRQSRVLLALRVLRAARLNRDAMVAGRPAVDVMDARNLGSVYDHGRSLRLFRVPSA